MPHVIPARSGKAVRLAQGQSVKVINTHGTQVVDTWAFNAHDIAEFMSMEHSRATHHHMIPRVGDALLTNKRRPILTLLEDTAGGIHDTIIAACDVHRYHELGHDGYHENCTDNLAAGLAELGLVPPETPSPFNLFMNIPWTEGGDISFELPVCPPNGYVVLRAEMDVIVAFSACPQDILAINAHAPTEAHFEII